MSGAKEFWQRHYHDEMQRIGAIHELRLEGKGRRVAAMVREGKQAAAERIRQAKRYLGPMWRQIAAARRLRLHEPE